MRLAGVAAESVGLLAATTRSGLSPVAGTVLDTGNSIARSPFGKSVAATGSGSAQLLADLFKAKLSVLASLLGLQLPGLGEAADTDMGRDTELTSSAANSTALDSRNTE